MRTLLLGSVLAIVSGCSSAPTKIYSGDGSLVSIRLHNLTNTRDAQIISYSARLWDQVGAHIRLETEESGGEILNVYLIDAATIPTSKYCFSPIPTDHIIGCYDASLDDGAIRIATLSENEFGTVAHEIGHAIGLHHIPQAGSLMYYEAGQELTDADILAYDDVWGSK